MRRTKDDGNERNGEEEAKKKLKRDETKSDEIIRIQRKSTKQKNKSDNFSSTIWYPPELV